jgi:hypothetical protein
VWDFAKASRITIPSDQTSDAGAAVDPASTSGAIQYAEPITLFVLVKCSSPFRRAMPKHRQPGANLLDALGGEGGGNPVLRTGAG